MKKNVGSRVQLVPAACRLNHQGQTLPPLDDEWLIQEVSGDGVRISNTRTQHTTTLGKDHIHHYTSNPDKSRGGIQYGFLTLNVQIFIGANSLSVRPNARPGEAVEPPRQTVHERWVDIQYPFDSGLQLKLESQGYRVAWCLDSKLTRKTDLEGWEVVIELDRNGELTKFRLRDRPCDQTLIKRRAA